MFGVECFDTHDEPISHYTQWDINQTLKIVLYGMDDGYMKNAPYVHFANSQSYEALVVPSTLQGDNTIIVDIPNILLQEPWPLLVYVYLNDSTDASSQKTIVKLDIPVQKRVRPSDYEYVENIDRITAEVIKQEIYDDFMDEVHSGELKYPQVTFVDGKTGKSVNLKVSGGKIGLYVDSNAYDMLDSRDIVNNLMTDSASKVLSAQMGAELKGMIDVIPDNIDEKIEEHDSSPTSHSDIRDDITSVSSAVDTMQDSIAEIEKRIDDVMLDDTISGSGILTITDALVNYSPIEVRIKGRTRQNLWVNPSGKNGGITSTSNDDGSVTVSGTTVWPNIEVAVDTYALVPGKTYTLQVSSAVTQTQSGANFLVTFRDSGGSQISFYAASTSGTTFTVPSNAAVTRLKFYAGSTVSSENTQTVSGTYRVMLNEGSTAEPWCPPGLNSVGQLREDEKNLWVNPEFTLNGVTCSKNEDGSFAISGTSANSNFNSQTKVISLKPGRQYIISIDNLPNFGVFIQSSADGSSYQTIGHINANTDVAIRFNTPSSAQYFRCGIQVIEGTTVSGTYKVMLNEGSTAKPWVPPEVDSCVRVVTAGKNLWGNPSGTNGGVTATANYDGTITVSGTNASQGTIYVMSSDYILDVKEGETFTLSCEGIAGGSGYGFMVVGYNDQDVQTPGDRALAHVHGMRPQQSFTIPSGTTKLQARLTVQAGVTVSGTYKVMLNRGETVDEWEPTAVTSITIDLQGHSLNALPDGTRDELHIDGGGNVVLEKRCGVATAPESPSSWILESVDKRARFRLSDPSSIVDGVQKSKLLCDKLPVRNGIFDASRTEAYVFEDKAYVQSQQHETASEIASAFGGATYIYPLAEPQTISLPPVTPPSFPSDKSNIYTTSNVPTAGLTVRYWKKGGELVANLYDKLAQLQNTINSIQEAVTQS